VQHFITKATLSLLSSYYFINNAVLLNYIQLPDRYESVLDNYVSYLNGHIAAVSDASHLVRCLILATYLLDDGYLNKLVEQIRQKWSSVANFTYAVKIPLRIQERLNYYYCSIVYICYKFSS